MLVVFMWNGDDRKYQKQFCAFHVVFAHIHNMLNALLQKSKNRNFIWLCANATAEEKKILERSENNKQTET